MGEHEHIYIEIVRFITKTKYNNQRVFGITSASIPSLEGKLYIHPWGCLPSQLLWTLAHPPVFGKKLDMVNSRRCGPTVTKCILRK